MKEWLHFFDSVSSGVFATTCMHKHAYDFLRRRVCSYTCICVYVDISRHCGLLASLVTVSMKALQLTLQSPQPPSAPHHQLVLSHPLLQQSARQLVENPLCPGKPPSPQLNQQSPGRRENELQRQLPGNGHRRHLVDERRSCSLSCRNVSQRTTKHDNDTVTLVDSSSSYCRTL